MVNFKLFYEVVRCRWCGREFKRGTKIRNRRKLPEVRRKGAVNCSSQCARHYNYYKSSHGGKAPHNDKL